MVLPVVTKFPGIFFGQDRMKTRYIGLEISFRAELDSFFGKGIKEDEANGELRTKLYDSIRPCVTTYLKKLSDYWKEKARKEQGEQDLGLRERGIVTDRKKINRKIEKAEIKPSEGDSQPKRTDLDIAKRVNSELEGQDLEKLIEELKSRGIVVQEKEWPGNTFVAMEQSPAVKALFWNTNSSFYQNIGICLTRWHKKIRTMLMNINSSLTCLWCRSCLQRVTCHPVRGHLRNGPVS